LEGEIEELKALDDEELKKLAKMEEVQALEGNELWEGPMDRTTGEVQGIDGPVLHTRPLARSFACQCSSEEIGQTPRWIVSSMGINGGDQEGVEHHERSRAAEETRIHQCWWWIQQPRIEGGHETI
jgi:hypothetical protein